MKKIRLTSQERNRSLIILFSLWLLSTLLLSSADWSALPVFAQLYLLELVKTGGIAHFAVSFIIGGLVSLAMIVVVCAILGSALLVMALVSRC